MMKKTELYYFSPTGGTKKVGETFAKAVSEEVVLYDLGEMMRAAPEVKEEKEDGPAEAELVIFAAPVFGGRLPAAAAEYLKTVKGRGKKAVSLVVYGVRAFEDALLELNDILTEDGFLVIASGAFVAQHSIVPVVGQGRPDVEDMKDIRAFVEKVLAKMDAEGEFEAERESRAAGESGAEEMACTTDANPVAVSVPGNHPYKDGMKVAATPICLPSCVKCGTCEAVCPTGAIQMTEEGPVTELSKCLLCMACKAACPSASRILPPPMQEAMNQKLGALKDVRRENETFL